MCMLAGACARGRYAERLLRILGHDLMMALALGAYALRCYTYTLLTPSSVHWLLAIEILHGISFGLAWTMAVDFVNTAVPAGWRTSGMMVLKSSMNALGPIVGQLVGGYVIEHGAILGRRRGAALYLLAAVAAGGVVAVHLLLSAALRLCGQRALLTPATTPTPLLLDVVEPLEAAAARAPGEDLAARSRHGQPPPAPTDPAPAAAAGRPRAVGAR